MKRWIQMDVTRGVGILIIVFEDWFVPVPVPISKSSFSFGILPLFFFTDGVL